MSESLSLRALLRLQSWMSPAFPIGAYTCSHGLESAIADGTVARADDARDWILAVLEHGSGRDDAIVLRASHAAVAEDRRDALGTINELALALAAGAARRRESVLLGASFRRAAAPWRIASSGPDVGPDIGSNVGPDISSDVGPDSDPNVGPDISSDIGPDIGSDFHPKINSSADPGADPTAGRDDAHDGDPLRHVGNECALPVAIGALAAAAGLPPAPVLATALQSTAANLAWIAARLVPLGQTETLAILVALEAPVVRLSERVARSTLDDLGGCALLADIDSLRHERLRSRVCRT